MIVPAGPKPHWRRGERLIGWMEELYSARKFWRILNALAPSSRYEEGWEAEVYVITQSLQRREPLWLRGHREESGDKIITLSAAGGTYFIRRGHIGRGHQEPDGGPFYEGPHVHFPTSVFREIGNRGRSRVYSWPIDPSVSLEEAIFCFVDHLNIEGEPSVQRSLLKEN